MILFIIRDKNSKGKGDQVCKWQRRIRKCVLVEMVGGKESSSLVFHAKEFGPSKENVKP